MNHFIVLIDKFEFFPESILFTEIFERSWVYFCPINVLDWSVVIFCHLTAILSYWANNLKFKTSMLNPIL